MHSAIGCSSRAHSTLRSSAPDKARENLRDLVRLVNVADRLVWGQGIDNGAKRVGADFDPLVALPEIRVDPGRYETILAEI